MPDPSPAAPPASPSPSAEASETARGLAARRIARRVRQDPEFEIGPLDTSTLDGDPRDAALAAAIDHAVIRRWRTLEAVLAPRIDRGWDRTEPRLRACLMVGAAQLLFLDRVPEHAAINSSVELAKRLVRPKAGGLVNAILRGITRDRVERTETFNVEDDHAIPLADGGAWRFRAPVVHGDRVARLASQASIDATLLGRWYAAFGAEEAERLALHTLVDAPIILSGVPAQPPRPDDREPLLLPHELDGFSVLNAPRETLDTILREHPGARVQDPVSARPVAATEGLEPALIIDACAGKGTKTHQLRALHPRARIVAADVDAARLAVLRDTMRTDRDTVVMPWTSLASRSLEADLLVLDVPCSNTGVLARRVEAKYRGSEHVIGELVSVQRQIVADTLRLLRPGGHVLYATCSVEPAENERQVAWLTEWHPLEVVRAEWTLPRGIPGDSAAHYHDGGGFALLRHTG